MVEGDPRDACTPMAAEIYRSWRKPLAHLTDDEIGGLVVQLYGFPYLHGSVIPKLEADPLYDGGHYPGDVLSVLLRAGPDIWVDRLEYQDRLRSFYERAMARPADENDAFRETLGLPELGGPSS